MALGDLALLVGADLGESRLVGGGIALDRDLRRHAAHREGAAAVAGLHQQGGVGAEERLAHHHLAAVGQDVVRAFGEFLDEGKNVIPAPGS